jgi:hypothetical protein
MPKYLFSSARIRPKRSLVATALIVGAGITLAACGSSSSPSSTTTKSTSLSSTKNSSKQSSNKGTSTSTSKQGGRCRSADLVAHMTSVQGAAGSVIRTYTLTNTGTNTCTLVGYPGLQMLTSSGAKLTTTVVRTPDTVTTAKLAHDVSVEFSMKYAAQTGYGSLSCPTSTSLEITPPNDYHYLTVTGPAGKLQPYGGTTQDLQCGIIDVQPVAPIP